MKRIILLALTLVVGSGLLVRTWPSGGTVVQPISFNHKKHVENTPECSACHESLQTGAPAGRPKIETCLVCHSTALTKSPEEEKIRQYAARREEIPWRRLYRLPQHVYFSHRMHVVSAKIECVACHGSIGASTRPPARAEINLSMDTCIACHQSRQASTDCGACHR